MDYQHFGGQNITIRAEDGKDVSQMHQRNWAFVKATEIHNAELSEAH